MSISNVTLKNDDISASCEVGPSGMCQPECLKSTDMNVKLPKSDIKSKETHAVAKPVPKSRLGSKPPSSSTLRLREYFSQFAANTNFGGQGENVKTITPTKRKLLNSIYVTNLVPVFDVAADNLPAESNSNCSASPAKKSKLNLRVKHLTSQLE